MSFGRELQLEREKLGVSLESLAEATKLSIRNLRALESNEFASLPGGVFQRGMVRSYCRVVGLDEHEWLERFSAANPNGAPEHDWTEFAENVKRTRISAGSSRGLKWWGVVLMVVGLAAIGWAAWKYVVKPRMHLHAQNQSISPSVDRS